MRHTFPRDSAGVGPDGRAARGTQSPVSIYDRKRTAII
jgi:hypothetical protein